MNIKRLHIAGNISGLFLLSALFFITFYIQIAFHHLPCPLCLLQRIGFAGVGTAIVFNLSLKVSARNYGLMLLSALFGLGSAMRHLFLHITPNDPGFGPPFWGLHLYTWSALIFSFILVAGTIALVFEQGFHKAMMSKVAKVSIFLFMLMIGLNALSSFLECGVGECPANPEVYQMLNY